MQTRERERERGSGRDVVSARCVKSGPGKKVLQAPSALTSNPHPVASHLALSEGEISFHPSFFSFFFSLFFLLLEEWCKLLSTGMGVMHIQSLLCGTVGLHEGTLYRL